jgi:Caspase domain/Sel1 repeat
MMSAAVLSHRLAGGGPGLLLLSVLAFSPVPAGAVAAVAEADKLFVVDCLLPGQVRKLGRQMTILVARRAVKTSGEDCEIRGGEYVAYDRANYATALNIWLPLAQQGDTKAQTFVGEIFEKGLGIQPDYATAAAWYQKAAEQGYARAQINLGFLHEKGLGVNKDPGAALNLYRKAAGIEGAIALDEGVAAAMQSRDNEIKALKRDLDDTRLQLDKVKEEKQKLELSKDRLAREKEAAAEAGNPSQVQSLEAQLKQREDDIGRQKEEAARLESEVQRARSQLAQLESARQSDSSEILALRQELEDSRKQLENSKDESQKLEISRDRLSREKEAAVQANDSGQIKKLEFELKQRDDEVSRQRREMARIENEMQRLREQLAKLEATRQSENQTQAALTQELEKAKQERQRLELFLDKLRQEKQDALQAKDTGKVQNLEAQLRQREQEVALQKEHTARIEQEIARYREQVKQLEAARSEEQERVAALQQELAKTKAERQKLEAVIERLNKDKQAAAQSNDPERVKALEAQLKQQEREIARQKDETARIEKEMQSHREQLAKLETTRNVSGPQGRLATARNPQPPAARIPPIEFGDYYALVIGNEAYSKLPKLDTAAADAKEVARILSEKYRFKVTLLTNATRYQILTELNKLRSKLAEKDNFLLYYAGHGELDRANLRGHWLPVDAEPDSDANWISSIAITDILNAMSAKHILVVADSCYSGAMTRSSIAQLEAGISDEARVNWIKALIKARSRTVLTSGGLQPVVDGGGGKHSIFAKYFIEVLVALSEPVEATRIYREISARVVHAAQGFKVEQKPEYAPLKFAGHESGDFLFVPVSEATSDRVTHRANWASALH